MEGRLCRTREARDAFRVYDAEGAEVVVKLCTRLLKSRHADPELYLLRGWALTEVGGKIRRALRDWRTATGQVEVAGGAHAMLADELALQAEYDAAIEHCHSAIRLGRVDAYNCWADICMGKYQDWAEGLRLTTLAFDSPMFAARGRALSLRQSCQMHLGNRDGAMLDRDSAAQWFALAAKQADEMRLQHDKDDGLLTDEEKVQKP